MSLPQEKLRPEARTTPQADLTKEYVVGTGFWAGRIGQILSNFVDDVEWQVGVEVYERMARDPVIAKNLTYQKIAVTADGVQLSIPIDDKDPQINLAHDIKDFCERNFENLHRPLTDIIDEMMNALKRAHTVAEIVYDDPVATGVDAYKLTLKAIKVKPRNSTAFVVDEFMNVLGLTSWSFGNVGLVSGSRLNGQKVVRREKFAVLTFETEDEDPRGVNPLRPAYNFWQGKCLIPGLHLKWLEKSGVPSTIGFTAPNAEDEVEVDDVGDPVAGGKTLSPQEAMANSLAQLESGSSAAFPNGASVESFSVQGTGQQFSRGYEDFDKQLDYALLLQSGATKDTQNGSRAAKQVLKDVADVLIWSRKHKVAQMLRNDVLKNLVRYNYGEEAVSLTPIVTLGDAEGKDWAMDAQAAAELAPYLTDSQWRTLCRQIGIAPPEENEELPVREKKATSNAPSNDGANPDGTGNAGGGQ